MTYKIKDFSLTKCSVAFRHDRFLLEVFWKKRFLGSWFIKQHYNVINVVGCFNSCSMKLYSTVSEEKVLNDTLPCV